MESDQQPFPILSPYSTNPNRMNQQPLLHPVPRQYSTAPDFYGNEPMLHNTRYRRSIKEEPSYIYTTTPMDFRGDMTLNVHHHPTHPPDHNAIRYPAYSSDVNCSNTIRMASSPLESPEPRLASGPPESASAPDFRYQIRALQPHQQQHLLHQQRHHTLNFYQQQSTIDEYESSPMVYDSLAHGVVRRDHGTNSNSGGAGAGSYHTSNSPVSSIPMSNNHGTTSSMNTSVLGPHMSSPFNIGPTSSRWAGHHPSSGFDMPNSTATAHTQVPTPASSTSAPTSLMRRPSFRHASESDSRSTPENSSSFTQDNNNNNNNFHLRLRTSTSAQTLSSSYSHTNSPSPRLSDNDSTSPAGGRRLGLGGGGGGSEMFNNTNNNNPDDRDGSDQDVDSVIRMSETNSGATGRLGVVVIREGEEVTKETLTTPPVKKKKKSKMHCCVICLKKFPRPSGLRTHMNTHSNEKPYPCEFPGCTRSFGVRSNAKRHLRTHGVIPTPATNPNSTDAPYIVGFCPPMIGVPQQSSSSSASSSHHQLQHHHPQHHQLHSIEGGGEKDFPPLPGGSRLPGDHNVANIHHIQDQLSEAQQQEIMNSVPTLKLRWMPPSLTTRTNAGSLREVVDEQQQQQIQQQHWMGDVVEEEEDGEDDDDHFATGGRNGNGISHVRRTSRGGYDMDQDEDHGGDNVEFGGENVRRLRRSIPLHPVIIPSSSSSSSNSAAGVSASSSAGIRLTVSRPAECTIYSPPCSESSSSTHRPSSSSSSRIIASSISPSSTTSFVRSNSSLSPPSTMSSGYVQQHQQHQQHEIDHISNVGGGGGDVYITENIPREYGV